MIRKDIKFGKDESEVTLVSFKMHNLCDKVACSYLERVRVFFTCLCESPIRK